MASAFAEALRRHSIEVQKLEGAQADEFLRLLKGTQEALQGRLNALGGGDDKIDVFRIRSAEAEAQTAIKSLELKAQGKYDQGAQDAVELATEHLGDELDRLSLAFDAKPLEVTIDAQAALADPAQKLLANHFETSVARYGGDLLNEVRQRLFIGLRTGDSFGNLVRDVASKSGPFGEVGKSKAERIVRTEISQAYGSAQHKGLAEAAKQVPALKKTWIHVGSWRCEVCMPLHGTERPIDGTWTIHFGRKTKEVAHAPAHPHCVCRVAGMKSSWRSKLQGLGYLDQDPEDKKSSPAHL